MLRLIDAGEEGERTLKQEDAFVTECWQLTDEDELWMLTWLPGLFLNIILWLKKRSLSSSESRDRKQNCPPLVSGPIELALFCMQQNSFYTKAPPPNPKHPTELFGAMIVDVSLTPQGRERSEQAWAVLTARLRPQSQCFCPTGCNFKSTEPLKETQVTPFRSNFQTGCLLGETSPKWGAWKTRLKSQPWSRGFLGGHPRQLLAAPLTPSCLRAACLNWFGCCSDRL